MKVSLEPENCTKATFQYNWDNGSHLGEQGACFEGKRSAIDKLAENQTNNMSEQVSVKQHNYRRSEKKKNVYEYYWSNKSKGLHCFRQTWTTNQLTQMS